jgi:uncharacterized damage-inducible protein DinB
LEAKKKMTNWKSTFALALLLTASSAMAQQTYPAHPDSLDGIWQGYNGEWRHVSNQLVALAEAIPADKFTYRPEPGVRSVSEVLMHIATSNFFLLSATGVPMPPDLHDDADKAITQKPQVIAWLKRSLEAVDKAHLAATPAQLAKRVKIEGRNSTVDAMYLRIIIHANEHMGQLIAYARMIDVTPPWSS